jgi:hypothetical protein
MALAGKGLFIWKLHRIAGGNVQSMVNKAKDAGLTHVIIKIADGASAYNVDLVGPATDAFKAAGIQVWGWAWLWMREPFQEAEIAAHRTKTLGLDGFVINAEHPAKAKVQEAKAYMDTLCDLLPGHLLALSSYRYPHFHTTLPWQEFLSRCDLNMPQMYWVGERPADCVRNSLARHRDFPFAKPIIATGAAYGEQYGNSFFRSEPAEIIEFLDAVRANGLAAANFWSWDWIQAHGPDLWDAIANYDWPDTTPAVQDIAEQFWAALTSGDLDALVALYHDNAVFITSGHTCQGPAAIRAQFAELLNSLPDPQFNLEELQAKENVRFLRWSAARVRNGLDTIGIRAGKIQYHSSSYQRLAD